MEKKQNKCKDCEKLQERCNELENNWKRALADFRNLQKRTEDERIEFLKYANEALLVELLGVLDNFNELVKHSPDDAGLKITVNSFIETLKRFGVEELQVLGKDFDTLTCDCIEMVEGEKNKVVDVTQRGYSLNGKIIRHARVKVGNGN